MTHATSSAGKPRMITGLFKSWATAERAYQAAIDRGYGKDDINLVMSDETRQRYFPSDRAITTELGIKVAEGEGADLGGPAGGTLATIGAAVGATVSAVGAFLLLPGLGIVVAGPIAAALIGAGAVAIAGGLIGALHNWGIPQERINVYEAGLKNGGVLMGLNPRTDEDARYFEQQWTASRAQHIAS